MGWRSGREGEREMGMGGGGGGGQEKGIKGRSKCWREFLASVRWNCHTSHLFEKWVACCLLVLAVTL